MTVTRREALAASLATLAGCQAPVARPRRTRRDEGAGIEGRADVGFVGDVMLARYVTDLHAGGPPDSAWGSAIDRLRSLDGLVANLECVLSDRGEPWPDKRWRFRAPPAWTLPALEAAGVSAVSLANNHTLDYGPVALADTREHLSSIGVAHAGAGPDWGTATEPAIVDVGDLTVAVVGLTDQFSPFAAEETRAGTAYLALSPDAGTTRRTAFEALARAEAADADLVVASLHWGPNYEPKTSAHRAFARWLIDHGVDVVHGHSAHELRGVEVYRGRPIVYDAGDLLNDYVRSEGHNDRSFLFELRVDDGLEALRLFPVEIDANTVRVAAAEPRAWLRDRVRTLSEPFGTTIRDADDGAGLTIPLEG